MNYRQIQEELTGLSDLKTIMVTYQEIAATRMQRVKDSVLRNRKFLDDIREIYLELRTTYRTQLGQILKHRRHSKNDTKDYSILTHNNKTVTVLLSSNTKLYGDIIAKTFNRFKEKIQSSDTDVIIAGKIGLQMYKTAAIDKPYTYFELSDGINDTKTIQKIIDSVKTYKEIIVVHGKYENILDQQAEETIVSTENAFVTQSSESSKDTDVFVQYLFEPSLEEILLYFENEIVSSLLEQTVYESNLSKFTSRMISLDATVENINDEIENMQFKERQFAHRRMNQKQLDAMAGISLWNR